MFDRDAVRFWAKVDFLNPDGCWRWTASIRKTDGYGQFRLGKRIVKAHRFAYALLLGEPPQGLVLDHRCRVRECVRPDHLEPVTIAENNRRGTAAEAVRAMHARRTHCKHGHEFTPENTAQGTNGRRCRTCTRNLNREYRRRKAAA